MRPVLVAFGRALLSQLHYRMLMLTFLPFVLSVLIWGLALWWGLQPMIDWLQKNYFAGNDGWGIANYVPAWLGLGALKTVIVPWLALWALLPLMILTALLFVGAFALPTASKDAALLVALAPGSYTAQVSGVGGTGGVVLVEVYEVP